MHEADPFAARLIEASAPAFAGLAASRMLELDPGSSERYAPDAFARWRESLAFRLRDLAVALEEGDPESFAEQVAWSRAAFTAREVPLEDLRASLDCLRAVLVEELPPAARAPAASCIELARERLERGSDAPPERLGVNTPEQALAASYLHALLAGDRREASRQVLEPVRAGKLDARSAMLDVLLPAQRELGSMWHLNEIGVAAEHFGTATTRMVIDQLAALAEPAPPNGLAVLTAAAPGDAHDVALSVVALCFELAGWRVVHLGADAPSDELVTGVIDFRPDLVALSATLAVHRREIGTAITKLRGLEGEHVRATPVLVGGLAFSRGSDSWRRTGADGYSARAAEAVEVGARLVAGRE